MMVTATLAGNTTSTYPRNKTVKLQNLQVGCAKDAFSDRHRVRFGEMLEWEQVTPLIRALRDIAASDSVDAGRSAAIASAAIKEVFDPQDGSEMLAGTLQV